MLFGQIQQRAKGFTFVDLKVLVLVVHDIDKDKMVYNVLEISAALMH